MKKYLFYFIMVSISISYWSCTNEDEDGCYCDFYETIYNESTGNFDYEFVKREGGQCSEFDTEGYFTEGNCD